MEKCVYTTKKGKCVSQREIDQAIFEISSGKLGAGSKSKKKWEWIWHPKFKENIVYDLKADGREPLEALTDIVESQTEGQIDKELDEWDLEMLDEQIEKMGDPVYENYLHEDGLLVERDFNGMKVCEWTDVGGYGKGSFDEQKEAGTTILKTCRWVGMDAILKKVDREQVRKKAVSDDDVVTAMTEELAYWGGEGEWVENVGD